MICFTCSRCHNYQARNRWKRYSKSI